MPGWVSYARVGHRVEYEVGVWLWRHDVEPARLTWFPIATRRTKWGRERLLRYLRRQSIRRFSYRVNRVKR